MGRISLLFICVAFSLTAANRLQPCHHNPCKNGGHCYRVGDYIENTFCDDGFLPYRGSCYNFILNPRTWDEGQRHCLSLGANLVQIESQDEREFIQSYLRKELDFPNSGYQLNVWTSGQPEGSWGNIEWMWKPSNRVIEPTFWDVGQPKSQTELSATLQTCVTVGSTSGYLNWVADSCQNSRNYYICEKEEPKKASDGKYLYQCDCRQGYSGLNCEREPDPNVPLSPTQFTKCSHDSFSFTCDQMKGWTPNTVRVDYAAYGMPNNIQPLSCAGNIDEVECVADNALMLLVQRCQGLTSCSFPRLDGVFSVNPCRPGSMNYLEYRMHCEHGILQCPTGSDLYKGRCYRILYEENRRDRMSWQAARNYCSSRGGDLVGPITPDEHHFLSTRLSQIYPDKVKYFWTGLRNFQNGRTSWTGVSPVDWQPQGSRYKQNEESCVAYSIEPSSAGQPERIVWITKNCEMPYNWICQFSPFGFDRPKLYDPFWNATTTKDFEIYTSTQSSVTVASVVTDVVPNPIITRPPSSPVPTSSVVTTDSPLAPVPKTIATSAPVAKPIDSRLPPTIKTSPITLPPVTPVSSLPPIPPEKVTQPSNTDRPTPPDVPSPGPGVCPETTRQDLIWPETKEKDIVRVDCPMGTVGNAFWMCDRVNGEVKFTPDVPDLSDCRQEWMDKIRTDAFDDGSAMEISQQLDAKLKTTVKLRGGDVVGSIETIEKLVENSKIQLNVAPVSPPDRTKLAEQFTQVIGESSNILLSEANMPVWEEIPRESRLEMATELVQQLEKAADTLTYFMGLKNNKHSFNYDNLAMTVEVYRPEPASDAPELNSSMKTLSPVPQSKPTAPNFDSLGHKNAPELSLPSLNTLRYALASHESQTVSSLKAFAPQVPNDPPEQRLRVGYFLYPNLGLVLKPKSDANKTTIVNSQVIGATINDPSVSIKLPSDHPVTFKFWHLRNDSVENPRCVFWNVKSSSWDKEGCETVNTSYGFTVCSCDHLTNFAVLMDFTGNTVNIGGINEQLLDWLTIIGCSLSCICLVLCLIVFTFFRSLWNDRNTIHRNLCLCLLIAELIFLFGIDKTENEIVCSVIAIVLHYFLLAAFCWMLMEGYQLYVMLVQVFEPEKSRILIYHFLAYCFPLLVVGVSAGLWYGNYGTDKYCWIDVNSRTVWAFAAPVGLVILINVVFLGLALKVVFSVHSLNNKSNNSKIKGWLKGSSMLLCLLGVTWAIGYLTLFKQASTVFAYIFTILNSLQGVFIFAFHVLLNDKVNVALLRCFRRTFPCCLSDFTSSAFNSSESNGIKKWVVNNSSSGGYSNSTATTGTNPMTPVGHVPLSDWSPTESDKLTTRWRFSRAADGSVNEKDDTSSTVDREYCPQLNQTHLCSKDCKDAHHFFTPLPDISVLHRRSGQRIPSRFVTNIKTGRQSKNKESYENPVVEHF